MKIGILTFEWTTNYGAVLQCYALQNFLQMLGHDAQIINYAPKSHRDSDLKCVLTRHPKNIIRNLLEKIFCQCLNSNA
jgi:hypothetical protein